jgi:Cft2 family RNA processing exonuclease
VFIGKALDVVMKMDFLGFKDRYNEKICRDRAFFFDFPTSGICQMPYLRIQLFHNDEIVRRQKDEEKELEKRVSQATG